MHCDAFKDVCTANPITLFSNPKVSPDSVKFSVWVIPSKPNKLKKLINDQKILHTRS